MSADAQGAAAGAPESHAVGRVEGRVPGSGRLRRNAPRIELVSDLDRRNGYLLSVDGVAQSYVDLDDPTYLELEYVALLAGVIDTCFDEGRRLNAAHLGAGGCTLARYLAATRPGSRQWAFDNDAELVDVVTEKLGARDVPNLSLVLSDARDGLRSLRDASAHAVVTDVFAGPMASTSMFTIEAVDEVRRVLQRQGLYLANIADRSPFAFARPVVATVRAAFEHVVVLADTGALRGRRYGHLIVVGSQRRLPTAELTRRAANAVPPVRLLDAARLDAFVRDAAPVTDASPAVAPVLRSWIYDRS